MKLLRITALAFTCLAASTAFAQWIWVDKDGRKVFSDQPPPSSVPDNKIIKRAGARAADPAAEPVAAAAPKASAASMPKVSGKDKELDEKRKAASAAEGEKKKAQEEEVKKARADSCERAKRAKATYDSGVRIATTNDKGEREYLDDNARAAEVKRVDSIIARDCGGAG
jgi:hypothetical protein